MKEHFVMRGQTDSGKTETLNFGGHKDGYGFILEEFTLFPGVNIGGSHSELTGSVTAGKTAIAPHTQNFNDEGLIGSAIFFARVNDDYASISLVNDTFVVTQDLILMVQDAGGSDNAINWQCKFRPVKLDTAKQALTNYRQFMIFDE